MSQIKQKHIKYMENDIAKMLLFFIYYNIIKKILINLKILNN